MAKWYSIAELCSILKLSQSTVRRLAGPAGLSLKRHYTTSNARIFSEDDLNAIKISRKVVLDEAGNQVDIADDPIEIEPPPQNPLITAFNNGMAPRPLPPVQSRKPLKVPEQPNNSKYPSRPGGHYVPRQIGKGHYHQVWIKWELGEPDENGHVCEEFITITNNDNGTPELLCQVCGKPG